MTAIASPAAIREGIDLLQSPVFSDLDRRFARFIAEKDGGASPLAVAAAALVSRQLSKGHPFLDLTREPEWDDPGHAPLRPWPSLADWLAGLKGASAVGAPGESSPMLLTATGKLYFQRYWLYEKAVADGLWRRAEMGKIALPGDMAARLDELFDDAGEQKQAAANALARRFSLISGGPGTGKTTTVLKILILMLERDPGLVAHLAAPTGKAAARLQESIRDGMKTLECSEIVRARIEAMPASTIHRLLGPIPGSVFFQHNERNSLPADVVVLDEASMVDLPLLAKLFAALPPGCSFIMLGDKDQLSSVEAGSALAGIVSCAIDTPPGAKAPPLDGVATILTRNYRFGNDSGIFRICQAVQRGDSDAALNILRTPERKDIARGELPSPAGLKEKLRSLALSGFGAIAREKDPVRAMEAWGRFQIITPLRQGPFGAENLNMLVEEILREEGLIPAGRRRFSGLPLMVTENDYAARLFNGDIGILLDSGEGRLMAYFRNVDGDIREISPMRLPLTEPAFAMTVHKSQGSEFDHLLMILPPKQTPILTRELIYTGLSRARRRVEVWCREEIFRDGVARRVERASGLAEMLTSRLTGNEAAIAR